MPRRFPKHRIPVSRPDVGRTEVGRVSRALQSGWISSRGPYVEAFERRFARWIGTSDAITTTSGTTALHLALASLNIGPRDEVIIPDFTMIACANAVVYAGATPIFVDVDPETWTITAELVKPKMTSRTKVIMPVHLYGHPVDMDPLLRLARGSDVAVVEDAAEAHGSTYRGARVGGLGTLGCFSFYSNKVITTGEGGMVVTRSRRLAEKARSLRDLSFAHRERDYHHSEIGFNYRMTSLQAALGLAQLSRARAFIRHRRACAKVYSDLLDDVPWLRLPTEAPWARSVFWMYTVRVAGGRRMRRRLMNQLATRGIETRVGFWPLHRQPFLQEYAPNSGDFPVSDALGEDALSLPSGNGVTLQDVEYVAHAIRESGVS